MNILIRAELIKLRTLRSFWWTIAATLAFVPVSIAISMHGGAGSPEVDTTEGFRNVIAAASSGGVLMLIIGILVMAGEFRHNTIASTFLITPDRKRAVGAKLAASGIVGVAVGVVASLLTLAIALPWLAQRNVDLGAHGTDILVVIVGGIAATALGGLMGVGLGALMTNQTLAVTATLVWILLVESLLGSFASGIGRWFPGGAASAMSSVAPPSGDALPFWIAGLLFAGYALVAAEAGTRLVVRRDIT
ncbi:MAG: type transport system permease protein [Gaiellales bacterium]|nr:type transport system permease protein [Gaiellales bacterium]